MRLNGGLLADWQDDHLASYYAMTAAKKNGTTLEEEMTKRGYVKDYYIGSGAWHWKKV
jgi:hypothetical protein